NPAVLAPAVGAEVRWIVIDQFDIRDQPSACIRALDQIVAEQSVTREPFIQHLVEHINFVNTFSRETAFAVQILINIGNRPRVDIESGLPGVKGSQSRAAGRMYADPDAWLKDSISADDGIGDGIDNRAVQRVRQGADKPLRGILRQLRITIERDDEADFTQHR